MHGTVSKSELIELISEQLERSCGKVASAKAESIVNCVFDAMIKTLQNGGGIEIRGFGSFTVRNYKAYEGRNPRTGEPVMVPEKRLPFFKAGKDLRERVAQSITHISDADLKMSTPPPLPGYADPSLRPKAVSSISPRHIPLKSDDD